MKTYVRGYIFYNIYMSSSQTEKCFGRKFYGKSKHAFYS